MWQIDALFLDELMYSGKQNYIDTWLRAFIIISVYKWNHFYLYFRMHELILITRYFIKNNVTYISGLWNKHNTHFNLYWIEVVSKYCCFDYLEDLDQKVYRKLNKLFYQFNAKFVAVRQEVLQRPPEVPIIHSHDQRNGAVRKPSSGFHHQSLCLNGRQPTSGRLSWILLHLEKRPHRPVSPKSVQTYKFKCQCCGCPDRYDQTDSTKPASTG